MQTQSESIDQLAPALVAAQAEIINPTTDSTADAGNFRYTYASLPSVLDAIRPVFGRHGLALLQGLVASPLVNAEHAEMKRGRDGPVQYVVPVQSLGSVRTMIVHSSGQWIITSDIPVLTAWADVQSLGKCVTYLRRVSLKAAAAIAEVDDDPQAARGTPGAPGSGKPGRSPTWMPARSQEGHGPRRAGGRAEVNAGFPPVARREPGRNPQEIATEMARHPQDDVPNNLNRHWSELGFHDELRDVVKQMNITKADYPLSQDMRRLIHATMMTKFAGPVAIENGSGTEDIPF
jgi:hypothetical protein